MKSLIPQRALDANKGSCGRVFIVAGSRGMTGAAVLSARGALRSGSGLVTVGTPKSEQRTVASCVLEAMTLPLPSRGGKLSKRAAEKIVDRTEIADAVVFGPGIGRSGATEYIASEIIKNCKTRLLIDADGINSVCGNIDILKKCEGDIVLTPHPGEMSRLTGISIADIQKNRIECAREFAERYGVTLVLKGYETVIASPNGKIAVNPTGNCGMATGGTGDVLSGVIGALMGQGLCAFDAARLGVYLHGGAGDIAAEAKGVHSLIASDVIECLPEAFITLCNLEERGEM